MNAFGWKLAGLLCLMLAGLAQADPAMQPDVALPATPYLVPESPIQQPIAPATPTPAAEPAKPAAETPAQRDAAMPPAAGEDKPPPVSETSHRKIRDTLRKLDDLLRSR